MDFTGNEQMCQGLRHQSALCVIQHCQSTALNSSLRHSLEIWYIC